MLKEGMPAEVCVAPIRYGDHHAIRRDLDNLAFDQVYHEHLVYYTLRSIRETSPDDELFFIVGADSFNDISTWREYAAIFGLCNVISVQRPGSTITSLAEALPVAIAGEFCYDSAAKRLNHCSGHAVYALDGVLLDISSSHIRLLVQGGRSIRYLIPDAVEQYIKEQRLYVDAR